MSLRGLRRDVPSRERRTPSSSQAERRLPADGAREERVEALAQARAGGILGGGDAHVMATVVLDEEVPVGALGQRHLGEPALGAGTLVAELVRGVDRDALTIATVSARPVSSTIDSLPLDHSQHASTRPAYWSGM